MEEEEEEDEELIGELQHVVFGEDLLSLRVDERERVDDAPQDGRGLPLAAHTHQLQEVAPVRQGEEHKLCRLAEHPRVVGGQRHHEAHLPSSPGVLYCPWASGPPASPSSSSCSHSSERCSRSSVRQPDAERQEKLTTPAFSSASTMASRGRTDKNQARLQMEQQTPRLKRLARTLLWEELGSGWLRPLLGDQWRLGLKGNK
ncbi:hypothetical protein EYF80_057228 [Liparis tanakae]|uniref:Uncharacterized protein n=1 Tax=Liparis tanakae TaxID=230148 RepID=A0A4Z2EVD8_9TELE|nr:hypothetical protein EYF80_057228 [Liparis tanakae]